MNENEAGRVGVPQEKQLSRLDALQNRPGAEAWLQLIQKATGAGSTEASWQMLRRMTEDGLCIAPLMQPAASDQSAPTLARAHSADGHAYVARIDFSTSSEGNRQALIDLTSGADGLHMVFSDAPNSFGFGLDAAEQELGRLFDGVYLDAIPLEVSGANAAFLEALHTAYQNRGISVETCDLKLRGLSGQTPLQSAIAMGLTAKWLVDGTIWHNAGATAAQELGLILADCADSLRALPEDGAALTQWAGQTEILLAANQDQFETLVKFRAMRLVWARLLEALNLPQQPALIGAETSYRMLSRRDPWTNVIRNSIAAAAAHMGGCDSLRVLPHTQANGLPDAAARRLARNTALILRDESHLAFLDDAAAGAPALEDLALQMAESAWRFFQQIEQKGGLAKSAAWVNTALTTARQDRAAAIEGGDRKIVGQTLYKSDPDPGKINVLAPLQAVLDAPAINGLDLAPIRESQELEQQEEGVAS